MSTKKNCGMHSIIDGHLKFKSTELFKEFQNSKYDPHSIIISCIDSRIVLSRITQTGSGEAFVSRNPGNLLNNIDEEAALELACLWNDIDTLVICGHR